MARITEQQRQAIADLRENHGWSLKRIASHLEISVGAVQYWANRLGAWPDGRKPPSGTPRKPYYRNGRLVRPFDPKEDRQIIALRRDGLSFTEIGRRLGRAHHSISMRLDQLNLWAEASEDSA